MDYKEKYEQALEVAQRFYNNSVAITKKGLEDIFPELKESIDERIKKVIKQVLSESTTEKDECYLDNGVTQQEVFAWLKKQGKNNMGISEATKRKLEDNLNKALEKETAESWNEFLEKQGEQKPVIPKFRVGDIIRWKKADSVEYTIKEINDKGYINTAGGIMDILQTDIDFELVEQKQEWSEEDEKIIETMCKEGDLKPSEMHWLKSLKGRVQPQPKVEWSEVDENTLLDTINTLRSYGGCSTDRALWLMSLKERCRPQNTWKPSDKQMQILHWCMPLWVEPKSKAILESLINDLKKLRGE